MDDVTAQLGATRLLPVIVLDQLSSAMPLGAALRAGGLRCAEVTLRTQVAAQAITVLAEHPDMLVGAGTVLTVHQVDQAVRAGARFIVSPGFSSAVVRHCQEIGIPVFPGVATATEIQSAMDAGVDTVKLFPVEQLGGVGTLKALAAPYPHMCFIPTGGICAGNLAGYLTVPSVLAVGGTWMVAPPLLAAKAWGEVTRLTVAAMSLARTPSAPLRPE